MHASEVPTTTSVLIGSEAENDMVMYLVAIADEQTLCPITGEAGYASLYAVPIAASSNVEVGRTISDPVKGVSINSNGLPRKSTSKADPSRIDALIRRAGSWSRP
jgi:hypothetical protein